MDRPAKDENAVAFDFTMVVITIILSAIIWAFLLVGLNPLISSANIVIGAGQMSSGAYASGQFAIGVLLGIPAFIIGGSLIFLINRAIEKTDAGA